ncbi:MAG: GNAT family N-acetyltransferase [Chitinophagaceae bacterium]|nr:GNAT family N-acetyltransferase [Chitinophagaceae bacterium]
MSADPQNNNAEYSISTDPSKLDLTVIHGYLSGESYWAKGVPMQTVQRAVANSFCFGVYHGKAQIGFARLVTDKATFAYLADVFILPAHRGRGLSKRLLQEIHAHPELQGFRRWVLATRDAHGLYEQFGWKPLAEELVPRFMQILNNEVYNQPPHTNG